MIGIAPYSMKSWLSGAAAACQMVMPGGMMKVRTPSQATSPSTVATDRLGFFRWGRVAEKVLLTTDGGDWAFLTEPEFAQLLAGEVTEGHPRFAELQRAGFRARIRGATAVTALADRGAASRPAAEEAAPVVDAGGARCRLPGVLRAGHRRR